jgi:hypothetical protein
MLKRFFFAHLKSFAEIDAFDPPAVGAAAAEVKYPRISVHGKHLA